MPLPPKSTDIISTIKYRGLISAIECRDKTIENPLLYKKEDYMCTDQCKQPLDQSISYDDIDTDDVEATYCFINNDYAQTLGKNISHDDIDHM